jgi:hypothetical protein
MTACRSKSGRLALAEQRDGGAAALAGELQAGHDRLRQRDLGLGHPPVGLGQVAHHREGGGEEGALDAPAVAKGQDPCRRPGARRRGRRRAPMRPQQRTKGTAGGEPEQATEDLAQPTHHVIFP